jgi:hypothetical protein
LESADILLNRILMCEWLKEKTKPVHRSIKAIITSKAKLRE